MHWKRTKERGHATRNFQKCLVNEKIVTLCSRISEIIAITILRIHFSVHVICKGFAQFTRQDSEGGLTVRSLTILCHNMQY